MPDTRILIIRLGALGDVVQASALVERIRAEIPKAHIAWVCGTRVESLVRLFDIDDVIVIDDVNLLRGRGWPRLRALFGAILRLLGRRYDLVALAHFDARYRVLLLPVRAGRTRVWSHSTDMHVLPLAGRAHSDEYARMLDADTLRRGPIPGHYALPDVRARLPAAPEYGGPRAIALIPGGARNLLSEGSHRRWPAARYAELARRLITSGYAVVLVGNKDDAWVRPEFAGLPVVDRLGSDSLPATLALLAGVRAVVSHDTGPLHLARLVRAPIVALFGPTTPHEVIPALDNVAVLWGGANLACRPCHVGAHYAVCDDHRCMTDIAVDDVLVALQTLASVAPGVSATPVTD